MFSFVSTLGLDRLHGSIDSEGLRGLGLVLVLLQYLNSKIGNIYLLSLSAWVPIRIPVLIKETSNEENMTVYDMISSLNM